LLTKVSISLLIALILFVVSVAAILRLDLLHLQEMKALYLIGGCLGLMWLYFLVLVFVRNLIFLYRFLRDKVKKIIAEFIGVRKISS